MGRTARALFLLAASVAPLQAAEYAFSARVTDPESGELLYTEHHREFWENGAHTRSKVVYRDPSGKQFGDKDISFAKSRTGPDFRTEDTRTGWIEGMELLQDGRYRVFRRAGHGKEMEESVMSIPGPVVADGGFDYFIRDNLKALVAGRELECSLVAAPRLDHYRFRVKKTGTTRISGAEALVFTMEPASFLLRAVADPMQAAYTREGLMLRYDGMTNIDDLATGHEYTARVTPEYAPDPPKGRPGPP